MRSHDDTSCFASVHMRVRMSAVLHGRAHAWQGADMWSRLEVAK